MPVTVLEVHKNDDGQWEAEITPVSSSHDVDSVESLDGFERRTEAVRIAGEVKTVAVYIGDDEAWVTWADAFGED